MGYRLAGEVMSFPGERVGNDKPPSGPTGELTCRDRTFVTDEDENIKVCVPVRMPKKVLLINRPCP